jgi:hypothetical protein
MANAKTKANRAKVKGAATVNPKAKVLRIGFDTAKYIGSEPIWTDVEITEDNRQGKLMTGFNWYNHSFGSKDAIVFLAEYLTVNKRTAEAKQVKRAANYSVQNAMGWLARMTMMGWELDATETELIEAAIQKAIVSAASKKEEALEADDDKPAKAKFNIQERMREKSAEAGGELEGMFDEFIASGAQSKHNFKPIDVLKTANILPAHAGAEIAYWNSVSAELKAVKAGKDADLKEAYSMFNKIQLRNMIKFVDNIVADYNGYVAFKKANKKVRKKKVKTPEQIAFKMKFLAEDKDLKLKSLKPAKIVGAKEVFAYDVKKRKLMYFVADEYAGELTVKNSTIVGFDVTKSTQKTVRKPKEQLKAFMAASIPNTRKLYKNTKSVEVRVSGRMNDNVVILKVK